MLVQTDKFGTSVAQSLRVHSETVRTKRRQRAEEAAAKTGVKMVFPLVFCIFPAIWVVTHRTGGDQVRPGPGADGARNERNRHSSADRPSAAPAPPVPATLEDTGLGADQSSSCSSRRCTPARRPASPIADRLRLPYAILEPLIERAARRAADRGARRDRHRHGRLSLRADRPRPRPRAPVPRRSTSTSARRRCRWPPTSPTMNALRRRARLHRPRAARARASRISSSATTCSSSSGRRSTPARRCSSTARRETARR